MTGIFYLFCTPNIFPLDQHTLIFWYRMLCSNNPILYALSNCTKTNSLLQAAIMEQTYCQLEAVVVASALDDMQAESCLAAVTRSLPRRYRHLSKINMAAALMLYRIIIIFLSKAGTLPYLMVVLNSTFYLQQFPRYQQVHKLFNCLRNLAPSYLMNMCHPVTSNLHRPRLRSAVRGGFIVPPTKAVRYGPCSFAVAGPSM